MTIQPTTYSYVNINGLSIHYREAGLKDGPTILLLHGFPTSSHMFRGLIPLLSDKYHLIAPDLPGFGLSDMPSRDTFAYTFDHLAQVLYDFTQQLGLTQYALYVFDYGAPVGLRLAMNCPERVAAIISQNGNAYEEGLSDGWTSLRTYWADPSDKNRQALRAILTLEATKFQYFQGVADPSIIAPEGYLLDQAFIDRPGNDEIQLDLMSDYRSNLALYPSFQRYFREKQPPLLAVWGKNDPYFLPAGAKAFKRDLPQAEVRLLDTGHFALETHATEIAQAIDTFMRGRAL